MQVQWTQVVSCINAASVLTIPTSFRRVPGFPFIFESQSAGFFFFFFKYRLSLEAKQLMATCYRRLLIVTPLVGQLRIPVTGHALEERKLACP